MRNIKYILINEAPIEPSSPYTVSNLGHHYVVNSQGMLLHPIDDSQPGAFMPKPACGQEDLNRCSIGVKYNGTFSDPRLRPLLIALLLDLRDKYPSTKILGLKEYNCYHLRVSDAMNQLRRELSDYP